MKNLMAVTVETCPVEGFICYIHEYDLDPKGDLKAQCYFCAKKDYASVVEVFEDGDNEPIHVFTFEEFECHCEEASH